MFIVWRGFLFIQHNQYNQYTQYTQIEAILSQYEIEVYEITKGRGTHICNTNKGRLVLNSFRGTKEKGEFLREYLSKLKACGFSVEQIELNKNGEAITIEEGTGEGFLLKEYIEGIELNVNRGKELKEAAKLLANFHKTSAQIHFDSLEHQRSCLEIIKQEKERHYRELVKAKNYIRSRKKKNDFEYIYLKHCDAMLRTAKESLLLLENQTEEESTSCFCHGDYNQHNVLLTEDGWRIINFENFGKRWCVLDLTNFIRKMGEKNDWELSIGSGILDAYIQERALSESEWEKLYALLLFPEKFWKVTNHYMNSRKTWISGKEIDKLKRVMEQEEQRLNFMENIFSFPKE